MKYILHVLKTRNSYETMGPLQVSTNHAVIKCTKYKHQNKYGTLLSTKNMAIYVVYSENLKDTKQQDSNEGVIKFMEITHQSVVIHL
jgi:hypothetical protein